MYTVSENNYQNRDTQNSSITTFLHDFKMLKFDLI